jgi:hypothetical protein
MDEEEDDGMDWCQIIVERDGWYWRLGKGVECRMDIRQEV